MFSVIYIIVITLTIFIGCGVGDSNTPDLSKCKRNWKSHNYSYEFYSIDEIKNNKEIYLEFNVKAAKDALIMFSPRNVSMMNDNDIYEVLIGGYENKKSTIREIPAKDKHDQLHEENGILSPTEYRQFWIRISLDGTSIEVGKKGDDDSIMSLSKKKTRNIAYYGIATWEPDGNKVNEVNWSFPCSEDGKYDMKKYAIDTAFANYSKTSPPNNLNQTDIMFVSQNTYFPDSENVVINGTAKITWKDERLTWELQSRTKTPSDVDVDYKRVWKPNITLNNGNFVNGTMNSTNTNSSISLFYNGSVTWTTPFSLITSCLPKGRNPHKPRLYCSFELTSNISNINFNFLDDTNSTLQINSTLKFDYKNVTIQDWKQNKSKFTAELMYDKRSTSNKENRNK